MPAKEKMTGCIWNSFAATNKKHLIITGSINSGKTTLISHLPVAPSSGLITYMEKGKGVYLKDLSRGEVVRAGIFDPEIKTATRKMKLIPSAFSSFGKNVLLQCIQSTEEWVLIDEIGYLEVDVTEYINTIASLMDKKRLIATVRKDVLCKLTSLINREDVFFVDLDNQLNNTGCVIMASGMGKRFGENKLLAPFNGKPMAQWIMDLTEGVFEKRVLVTRHREIADIATHKGIDVVLHSLPGRNDTIRLGLEKLGEVKSCVFLPCDQPLIKRETLEKFKEAYYSDLILRAEFEGAVGMPVLFPSVFFEELKSLPEGCGGNYVIKKHPDKVKYISCLDAYELKDIDTKEDLEKLERYVKQ